MFLSFSGDGVTGVGFTLNYDGEVVATGSNFGFSFVHDLGYGCE